MECVAYGMLQVWDNVPFLIHFPVTPHFIAVVHMITVSADRQTGIQMEIEIVEGHSIKRDMVE